MRYDKQSKRIFVIYRVRILFIFLLIIFYDKSHGNYRRRVEMDIKNGYFYQRVLIDVLRTFTLLIPLHHGKSCLM